MTNDITEILSKHIDPELIMAMMSSYDAVQNYFHNENYEDTLSKSGKFVENVFRVLYYILTKNKLAEIKPGQINDIIDKLEKADGLKFSETIRIVIPRVASVVYTMRSKLGAEHVKPIIPDFIDARATVANCDWIVAELLRSYHIRDSFKVDELIQKVKTKSKPKLESFEVELANKVDVLSIPELIITILASKNKQTKDEIKDILTNLGKDIGLWLRGGNFNNRLIKKGLVMRDGKNDKNEEVYSLTIRGMIEAEKIIDRIKS